MEVVTIEVPDPGPGEVLVAIEFDDQVCGGTEEIDFHVAAVVERDGELDVELEFVLGVRKTLQALIEEALTGTAGLRVMRLGDMDKELCQGRIDAIVDEAADTGGVVGFPLWIERERNVRGPTRQRAGRKKDGIADGFVAITAAIKHPRQHRDIEVCVVEDLD